MGMPQVPERESLPSIEEVVIQILESVAIEELAMAHIINAEGEKMQALVKQMSCERVCLSHITEVFSGTESTINSLIMKEWIMLGKIKTALDIYKNFKEDRKKEHECKSHDECERCYEKNKYNKSFSENKY